MLKNIIILPDGTEIKSGVPGESGILSVSVTETVNKEKDLTPGDANAIMMEAKIWTQDAETLAKKLDSYVNIAKVDTAGNVYAYPGEFDISNLERSAKNTLKIVAYSPLRELDVDLTDWINSLTGWPYSLIDFAGMVCNKCGLSLFNNSIPNDNFPVHKINRNKVTGRQLIKWIGEICCRYLTMHSEALGGLIRVVQFGWYSSSGVTLEPTGENYYYSGGQIYSLHDVPDVESVHVLWKDNDGDEYLLPSIGDYLDHNYFTITDNALFEALPRDEYGDIADANSLYGYLNVIAQELSGMSYTPCKLSCPARMDIRPGQTFTFIGHDGKAHKALCMKKITKGQKDTIECTGNMLRKQYHK